MKFLMFLAAAALATPVMALPIATCPQLAWTEAKTANPSQDDISALKCLSKQGDPDAGFILAMLTKAGRGMAADPADARDQLVKLAKGRNGGRMATALGTRTRSYAVDVTGAASEEWQVAPYAPAMRELAKMQLLGQGGDADMPGAMAMLYRARGKDKEADILYDALKAKGY